MCVYVLPTLLRERNREHAKRSRVRKKFLLESLQKSVTALQEENEKLRGAIRANLGADEAKELLSQTDTSSLISSSPGDATKVRKRKQGSSSQRRKAGRMGRASDLAYTRGNAAYL